jgi:hypothetical protein
VQHSFAVAKPRFTASPSASVSSHCTVASNADAVPSTVNGLLTVEPSPGERTLTGASTSSAADALTGRFVDSPRRVAVGRPSTRKVTGTWESAAACALQTSCCTASAAVARDMPAGRSTTAPDRSTASTPASSCARSIVVPLGHRVV